MTPQDHLTTAQTPQSTIHWSWRSGNLHHLGWRATRVGPGQNPHIRHLHEPNHEGNGRSIHNTGASALRRALKNVSNMSTLLSVLCRIITSGVWAGYVLSFRWIPSELNYSDKGSRFFNGDHDPSKSLLHVLAQRLTRSSPERTSDQDCLNDASGRC